MIKFGTDGIRGIYGEFPMQLDCIGKIINGLCLWLNQKNDQDTINILIGRDTRESGNDILKTLSQHITQLGANVYDIGIAPTPAVSYLTENSNAQLGIMITASHNPKEYNGLKFFSKNGGKFNPREEKKIEEYINNNQQKISKNKGQIINYSQSLNYYLEKLNNLYKEYSSNKQNTPKTHLVIDCANGALSEIAEKLLQNLDYQLTIIGNQPNGNNINDNVGATHPQTLQKTVIQLNADIGISFDGDGDRIIICTEKGKLIDGDALLWFFINHLPQKIKGIVGTQMTNTFIEHTCQNKTIKFIRTPVGDKYILDQLIKNNWQLGGESSGHILLVNHLKCADAMLAAILFLSCINENSLEKIFSDYQPYKSKMINLAMDKSILKNPNLMVKLEQIQQRNSAMRCLIRASGTENLIRVMVEGKSVKKIEQLVQEICLTIEDFNKQIYESS